MCTIIHSALHRCIAGGSWAQGFFCPTSSTDALSLVLTKTEGAKAARAGTLGSFAGAQQPIVIDEAAQTVTVEAGVPVGAVLDYLSAARSGASPSGWALPTYPSAADATMAGVIATGSHSSSTAFGSLSNQVVGLTAVLANGTVVQLSEAASPHLFRAMLVSVGRLGVITSVTSRIKPQGWVRKTEASHSLDDVFTTIQDAATAYAAAGSDAAARQAALAPLDRSGEQGALEERWAFPSYHDDGSTAFDGYEVSVPLAAAAGCLEGLHDMVRGVPGLAGAFTKPISIRFASKDAGYLAYTQGGPRVFCSGRLHWGKAGWQLGLALSGAADYGAAWCSFGCAAQQLDPEGKFAGASDLWQWNATRDGAPADFASCCIDAGFDTACQCVS
ncbi:hypothetical protein ABPG75_011324 [Micractinium tetrahymenae]